ncbi:hypothetical protein HZC30_07030 [Candidatus Woesearchaeota archaeon]|nr:hypothetical protein [Candidatus Woesearchaeota archaeon]
MITLKFLQDWGILNTVIDPIEGFTRFLILIVLFAVLFKGAELLKLGKNVAIVIAIVFSLLTAIFIPGTILLAAAASYGTIFSLVLLGLPIGLGFAGYFFLKEYPWIRVGLMGLLWLLLLEMSKHIGGFTTGAGAHYGGIVASVVGWIDWVTWIVFIIFIINGVQALLSLATGHASGDMDVKKTAQTIFNWAQKGASRRKTAMMNEYIEEEKELKLLDKAIKAKDDALEIVGEILTKKEITNDGEKNSIIAAVNLVETELKAAKTEFRRVKGRTWRQERRYDGLVKEFKDKDKDVARLDVNEKIILEKHNEAITKLNGLISGYHTTVSDPLSVIKSISAFPFSLTTGPSPTPGAPAPPLPTALEVNDAVRAFKSYFETLDVKEVEDAQKTAIQAVQGIVTETRELMKWKD